jgi:hypothetical protein
MLARRRLVPLIVAVVVFVAVVLTLFVVPVSHSFSLRNQTFGDLSPCSGITFPKGAHVTGSWIAPSATQFYVVTCSFETVYSATGISGSFEFIADGSTYSFGTYNGPIPPSNAPSANVTGTYTSPIF